MDDRAKQLGPNLKSDVLARVVYCLMPQPRYTIQHKMFFYTRQECEEWCSKLGVALDDQKWPERAGQELNDAKPPHILSGGFPTNFSQLLWFAKTLEDAIQPRQSCLVWITEYGIFESNENLHLYYRLRNSYGDFRHLHDAPGHLCLNFERPEVVTLLHLSILFGWDAHIIPVAGYARAFVSHDEWFQIAFSDEQQYEAARKTLLDGSVPLQ
jgi:hypothetical protein